MYFFEDSTKSTVEIAKEFLGYRLIHQSLEGVTAGLIVETEAYVGEIDQAAHSYAGRKTPRLKAMYQAAGHFYIYQMRGLHLVNIVTQEEGTAHAVLIRAIEPTEGKDIMLARRNGQTGYNLTNGPGKLAQAMGIDMNYYGESITKPPLYVDLIQKKQPHTIEETPRIGIPNKGKWTQAPLRFIVGGNPYVSRFKGSIQKNNGWNI